MKICDSYEINLSTLAVVPILGNFCRVYEKEEMFIVKGKSTSIVNSGCRFFCSSLSERQQITKRLINVSSKAPIVVEGSKMLILFPTGSPRDNSCIWISFNNISKYFKENARRTKIVFKDKTQISVPVSYNIVDNQISRCLKLEKELDKRRKTL